MSKIIQLTQQQFAIVNDDIYYYLMQWKYHATYDSHTKGFRAARYVGKLDGKQVYTSMHRDVWEYYNGSIPSNYDCCHINRKALDNRINNLKIVPTGHSHSVQIYRKCAVSKSSSYIKDNISYIALTNNEYAIVDNEIFNYINKWNWNAHFNITTNTFYAQGHPHRQHGIILHMHRVIWEYYNGAVPPKMQINHLNHNTLDNRRNNLQLVTNRQNCQDKLQKNGGNYTSIYPGVYWNSQKNKWHATININGKSKHLGYYLKERDAYLAYKRECETIGEPIIIDEPESIYQSGYDENDWWEIYKQ